MLAFFRTIVAHDLKRGIGKNGDIPWKKTSYDDRKFFQSQTMGGICIMGKKTWESLPSSGLPGRLTIVISKKRDFLKDCTPDFVVSSLYQALQVAAEKQSEFDTGTFICGGEQVYYEALADYRPYCLDEIVTVIPQDWNCDRFYPSISHEHSESQYLAILRRILVSGKEKVDRTGVGTRSIFGSQTMKFDLREGFPLLTTKRVSFKNIKAEFEMMWNGRTDTKELEKQGINIWRGNTSESFLRSHNLPWEEGDMGPGYGFQWRHWGEKYQGSSHSYQGIDQLEILIRELQTNPGSRRLILTAWNVSDLEQMALPPCHCFFQCNVGFESINGEVVPVWLDGQLYQRSGDMFLGVPYNIAFYSLMIHRLAKESGLIPRYFHHLLGDAHIYNNHLSQVELQLQRTPLPWCHLTDQETIEGYQCHGVIKAEMAV